MKLDPAKIVLSIVSFLIICISLFGCATYGLKMEQVQAKLARGKYDDALKKLEKLKSNRSALLYLLEKGTILHYAGRYQESNEVFEQAVKLAEDLYTKSISAEAGSLLTSDNILPYAGEPHEIALIHYYKALNYVKLNMPDSALVECRRIVLLLRKRENENKDSVYSNDAFLQYFAGLLFEWTGELNDAFIAYRNAERAFEKYDREFKIAQPPWLSHDIARLAHQLGFTEEYEHYLNKYKIPEAFLNQDQGRLIMIYENGFAPKKTSQDLLLPILKEDKLDAKTDVSTYSQKLVARANKEYSESELEYLLRVSLPAYVSNRPNISYMKLIADGVESKSQVVQDIEAISFRIFNEKFPKILLKTSARGVMKYLTYKAVQKKQGEGLATLVNIVNIATESADTRSWISLPNNIQLTYMSLPPGKYNLQLLFYSNSGRLVKKATMTNVSVAEGKITIVNYRTFQ